MGQEGTPISAGASGTVIIWDDLALGDAITLSITGVTPPEAGTVYEGWLVSDDGSVKKSTGILTVADDGTVNHTLKSAGSVLIGLNERNSSGQTGYAILSATSDNQTDVTLNLSAGAMETQAVHIHTGQCGASLGGVVHPLTSFVGGSGMSVTRVIATLNSLRTGGFAINTHQAGNAGTYTSCGNISMESDSVTLALNEMNASGQTGWASLNAKGGQTEVVVSLAEGVVDTELVHIHTGQCGDTLGGVVHSLSSFTSGFGGSVTMVGATLASLRNGGFAINSHKAGEAGVYTTCGNILSDHSFYSGENLIDTYNKAVITVEPIPDNDPGPSTVVLAIHEILLPAMAHIRHLLTDWKIPAGSGILTNLKTQLALALLHSRLADNSTTLAGVRQHIEHVVNIIEGPTGANFGDLDGNGSAQNPGDGVGALVHAADRKHAGFASAAAADDTVIADHAAKVMEYGGNAETWAIQARDEALRALTQSNVLFAKLVLSGTIGLLDSALHGNANTGEGGADQAYVEGQLMATYSLMPGAPPPKQELTPTPVPTPTPTPTPEVKPPDSVGETSIPAAAQMALALAALLLVSGGLLVLNGRRSRA
jgi:hypothetical protein